MKQFKPTILILLIFVVTNCSKDETSGKEVQPKSVVYFTLNIDENKDTSKSENWIIIHDENGKLLDYKPYENGMQLIFSAPIEALTEKINVTEFNRIVDYVDDVNDGSTSQTQSEIGVTYDIFTTTEVEIGTQWDYGANKESIAYEPAESGKFELSITNIPQILNLNISTKSKEPFYSYSSYPGTESYTFRDDLQNFEGEDEYFVSILDGYNNLNYLVLENPVNMSIDYAEFKSFDNYVEVEFPEHNNYSIDVAGFKDFQEVSRFGGFKLLSLNNEDDRIDTSPFKFGYLNRFNKFRTIFNIKMENYSYEISKYGDRIENIQIPEDPNLVIDNPSFHNFLYRADTEFMNATHSWEYVEGVYPFSYYSRTLWSILVKKGYTPSIGKIPEEILNKYSDSNIDKIEYSKTYLNLQEEKYENLFSKEGITIYKQ